MPSLNLQFLQLSSAGLTIATTAYTDGDIVGTEMTITIPQSKSDALIMGASLTDKADVVGPMDLFFFHQSVTMGSDNAAPTISDADAVFGCGVIQFPFPFDMGGVRKSYVDSIAMPIHANASSAVFCRLVTRSGHTFFGTNTDIWINLYLAVDV